MTKQSSFSWFRRLLSRIMQMATFVMQKYRKRWIRDRVRRNSRLGSALIDALQMKSLIRNGTINYHGRRSLGSSIVESGPTNYLSGISRPASWTFRERDGGSPARRLFLRRACTVGWMFRRIKRRPVILSTSKETTRFQRFNKDVDLAGGPFFRTRSSSYRNEDCPTSWCISSFLSRCKAAALAI